MNYRREIDGLRALAVVPVILFHAGFQAFSGGFVGVDVFFVISGYLITSIILAEKQTGTFSIINFWERRARRILPALFFVMLVCLPFAWLWLLPQDMKNFSQSLVAVSIYASNFLFWQKSGYFETATELKPLLHTWSLAVEEQYYLLFPIFIILIWKLEKYKQILIFVAITVTSLALAQWASIANPAAAFYLLPTRGWELLIGAFVALYFSSNNRWQANKTVNELGGVIGLALLVYSVFTYNKQTPFPSLYTLAPTIGTATTIIFSSQHTAVGKILGNKLFVGMGLISYSAYLWHQPLFAFARHISLDEPSKMLFGALAIVAILLAYLTWRYVETPFRCKQRFDRKQIFLYGILCSIFFIAIGLAGHKQKIATLWELSNPNFINITLPSENIPFEPCPDIELHENAECKIFGKGNKRRIVVWGDSHARVLGRSTPNIEGIELYIIGTKGCPPIINVRRFDGLGSSIGCDQHKILNSYADYIKSLNADLILLAGRWTLYLNGWQKKGQLQNEHHFVTTSDINSAMMSLEIRKHMVNAQLQKTVESFSEKSKVTILAQPPDYASYGFRRMERTDFKVPIESIYNWHKDEIDILNSLDGFLGASIIDTKALFCDKKHCVTRDNGALLYFDDNHLSAAGASKVWSVIVDEINNFYVSNDHDELRQLRR